MPKPKTFGPIQMANFLGLQQWQMERGRADGRIPAADVDGRWSERAVNRLAESRDELVKALGQFPDVGAWRAAGILSGLLVCEVEPYAVEELSRQGLIPVVGDYKGSALYCGRALERFGDRAALETAMVDGRLLTSDEAAEHLRIRRTDFDHLVRAGRLRPTSWARSEWQTSRARPAVALYRDGDLRVLLHDETIDWAPVRDTPKGRRSPLAGLPTADPEA